MVNLGTPVVRYPCSPANLSAWICECIYLKVDLVKSICREKNETTYLKRRWGNSKPVKAQCVITKTGGSELIKIILSSLIKSKVSLFENCEIKVPTDYGDTGI